MDRALKQCRLRRRLQKAAPTRHDRPPTYDNIKFQSQQQSEISPSEKPQGVNSNMLYLRYILKQQQHQLTQNE